MGPALARALAVLPKWPNVVRRQKGDTLAYAWVGDDLPDLPWDAESEPEPERATPRLRRSPILGPPSRPRRPRHRSNRRCRPLSASGAR
ncbi:hypothetical protein Asp14428_09820 [Actinoplanes sp. NBRC 14428]|nr:hypothetical protein Asp14428_09820 [Actinoplanes sp. NBRC 14428]